MNQELINVLRDIHRELIVSNWNTTTQKQKQRKLFQLLDVVELAQDDKTKQDFVKEIAKLKSQGFVGA
jgi:hypothetical protein